MVKIINFIKLVKNYFVISFLAIIFIASSWSLLRSDFFRTHDYVHGARIAEMTRALADGHFPVRWSENFGYGFGMPLFEFYAPLPYYVGSLFYSLGLSLLTSVRFIFLLANIVSLIGAYKLGKYLLGNRGGIIAAAAFTLAPYRAVNLFVRGALSEAWGMMALPWILLGIVQLIKEKNNKGFFPLVLGLVTLMLSHNLTTLMFVPFSFVFAIGYLLINHFQSHFSKLDSLKKLGKITGFYVLSGGLSAFYVLPAFLEKQYTQVSATILGGYFDYNNHFLYIRQFFFPNWGYEGSSWGPDDGMSFFLGYGQLTAIIITILGFVYFIKEKKLLTKKTTRDEHFYFIPLLFILMGASLFMTILKSKFIWDTVPLLEFIQFPWRFISVAIVFLALLSAYSLKFISNIVIKLFYFLFIFWFIVLGNFYFFRPEKFITDAQQYYYADEDQIRIGMSDVLKDYVPSQMSLNGAIIKEQFKAYQLPSTVTTQINKTHQKLYAISVDDNTTIVLPIANFPGWKAEVDGEIVETKTSEEGLLSVDIPAGQHQVGVYFASSSIRLIADSLSLVSFLVFLYLIVDQKMKREKTPVLKRIF